MRLKLTLRHAPNSILPKDYEYLISSWIYKTLWQANTEFATWLHNEGYDFNDRKYKLFTFSQLMPERYEKNKLIKEYRLIQYTNCYTKDAKEILEKIELLF